MGSRLRLVPAVCVLVALAGCLGNPVEIQHNEEFGKTMRNLSRTVPLRKLTDFSWEHVYTFHEGAPAKLVNGTVGQPVLAEDSFYYDSGNLFVFTADGEVVKALSVIPDLLVYDRWKWGPKVLATAGEDGGAYRLIEPDEPAENA